MKKCNLIGRAIGKTTCYFALLLFGLMLLGDPVLAQDVSSSEKEEFVLEEITVTGSRIRTSGMETPTPVTVVVPDEIELTSPTTMIEGLAELPQFYGSSTTQNTGGFFTSTGAGTLNLRGLQSKRTLQLLNGRRVVPSTIFGGPDINLFPELLIRSVETVTGGASAAYGTDAVAGVVNFLLDTEYEGIKGHVQRGRTELHNNKNYELEIAGGFALTDRTRVLFSAEKEDQDPIYGDQLDKYDWYDSIGLVKNPSATAGSSPDDPFYIPAAKLYSTTTSINGILLFTPAQGGQYTFDSAGNAVPYVKGTGLCTSNGQLCATPNADASSYDTARYDPTQITPDTGRENFYGYIEHNFSDKLKVYLQAIYGKSYFVNKNYGGVFTTGWGAFTIYRENPFLPQNIQDLMDANSLTSVKFSRVGGPDDIGFDAYTEQQTKTLSLTTGFDYDIDSGFFNDWLVKGYLQHGKTDVKAIQRGGVRLDRIYLAMDVVTDPLTGQPACNVAVQTRGTANEMYQDCVPLNLFGAGRASQAAIDWVTGFEPGVQMDVNGFLSATESMPYSYITSGNKQRIINIDQTVFEISADGELYGGWGAGPISMAVGYNYREESFTQVVETGPGGNVNVDPTFRPVLASGSYPGIRGVAGGNVASGNIVEIQFSNVPFARGDQNVHEIFDEVLVPIVSDLPFVKQLNFNGAARWAKYSGAGVQWSWKGGLDWAVYNDLRFRSTLSHDVRAATIGEKFDRTGGIGNIADYLMDSTGATTYAITVFSNGSPNIQPEKATTETVGLVYQPRWLKGLSFSTDWYNVEVKDNIQQMSAGEVVRRCYQENDQQLCNLITRGGAAEVDEDGNPITRITLVGQPYINQASVKAVGIDFELGYYTPVKWFGGGESINFRLLGSYVGENSSTNASGVKVETVGITYPKWVATLSYGYRRDPLVFSFQHRYTDKTLIYRNWNYSGTSTRWDVYDNTRDSEIITDARVSYRFDVGGVNLNLYLNVNNLFDKPPQPYLIGNGYGGDNASLWGQGPGLGVTGDLRGRRYVLGLSFDFE
jgi:iron complex outermembrane receptor protein